RRFDDLDLDDIFPAWEVEHDLGEHLFENRSETSRARASLQRLVRNGPQRALLERQLHLFEVEQLRVLLGERVLGLLEDTHQGLLIQRFQWHCDWKPPD